MAQGTAPTAHRGRRRRERGERAALQKMLEVGVLLFQQSSSSSFFFFSTLVSLRDLIVSQVAHQVHSIGRLEKDVLCIDE